MSYLDELEKLKDSEAITEAEYWLKKIAAAKEGTKASSVTKSENKAIADKIMAQGYASLSAEELAALEAQKAAANATWFKKSSAFEDGHQFGDVIKTVESSSKDLATNVAAGILGLGEKVVDTGATVAGWVGGKFGNEEFEQKMGEFVAQDLYDEKKLAQDLGMGESVLDRILNITGLKKTDWEKIEGQSVFGEKSDSLAQSFGQLLANVALKSYGVPWFLTTGVTSFASATEGALRNGATLDEAAINGLISAGAEMISEKLFGGSGLGEKGLINVELFTKNVSNKVIKALLDFGIDVTGEGIEEVVSEFVSTLGEQLTYEREQTLEELLSDEAAMDNYIHQVGNALFGAEARKNYGDAFIGGAALGGIMNAGKVTNTIKEKTDYRTGLTDAEEAVVSKAVEKQIAEKEANGEKVDKKVKAEIRDKTLKDLEKGYISTDAIEEALGEDVAFDAPVVEEVVPVEAVEEIAPEVEGVSEIERAPVKPIPASKSTKKVNLAYKNNGETQIAALENKYGTIPEGEHPVRSDNVPKSTTGNDKVSRTARTVKGAEATPEEYVGLLNKQITKGRLSYIPINNSDTTLKAYNDISKKGWEVARGEWEARARRGEVSAEMSATGALLLNNAAKAGDAKAWLDILHTYQLMGTNAGQAVQAMRILKTLNPDDSLYMIERSIEQMVEDMKLGVEIEIDEELKNAYLNAKTDAEKDAALDAIEDSVASQIPATNMEKWTALRYLNMLGNFRTQIRNVLGNVGMSATNRIKNTIAASIESLASKISGGKIKRTKSVSVGKDLLNAAKEDFANVEHIALNGGKFNDANAASTKFQQGVQDKRTIFNNKLLEGYRRATDFAMNKGDLAFSKPAYARALAGYLKANGITDTDFSKIDQSTLDEARAYAVKEAQEATFRDNNWLSSWVSKVGRQKNTPKIVKTISEGLMPFRKTPANILLRAEEYSPLGIINATVDSIRLAKGSAEVTGADVINSWSKALTGTGLFALGMLLNNAGALAGSPDEDEEKDRFESQYGWQNYAIKIGDYNFTIDFLSPSAMPLLMGAQFNELRQEDGVELKDLEKALLSIADPMIEMSMLQGVSDSLDNVRYAESNMGQFLINSTLNYFTQGLTNTFLGQLERSFEGQRMTTYIDKDSGVPAWIQKELGKVSAKIPGWDYQQIPYVDAWGEMEDYAPLPSLAENTLSPSYIDEGYTDEVYNELNRLNDAQSNINVYPQTPEKTLTFEDAEGNKHEDYNLSADEYVELATVQGQTQKQLVEEIISSKAYASLSDTEKAKAIQLAYQYAMDHSRREVLGASGYSSSWMENPKGNIADAIIAHTNDERAFAYNYPERYKYFKENGITYEMYASADENGKRAYTWAADNPRKHTLSKAVTDDVVEYRSYASEINKLNKEKAIEYIEGLDIDAGAKMILYKTKYKSDKTYNRQIVAYLNSRDDIDYNDMKTILEELGAKVDSKGKITWD